MLDLFFKDWLSLRQASSAISCMEDLSSIVIPQDLEVLPVNLPPQDE
jgi:hypothetical protein